MAPAGSGRANRLTRSAEAADRPVARLTTDHANDDITRLFIANSCNHGTVCDGCLSVGSHGGGGYLCIGWNGAVTPCVFVPYSPVSIKAV